jgi:hypothetical protein
VYLQEPEREKTEKLNMERDTIKLWRITKAMNDEGYSGETTLEDDDKTLTGKTVANTFAKAYSQKK